MFKTTRSAGAMVLRGLFCFIPLLYLFAANTLMAKLAMHFHTDLSHQLYCILNANTMNSQARLISPPLSIPSRNLQQRK